MSPKTFRHCQLAGVAMVAAMVCAPPVVAQSLYRESTYRPLIGDNKAFRAGDVLTVQIYENSSATTTADTATRRKNGLAADLSYGYTTPRVARAGVSVGGDFDGGGRTQRANRLLTTITVTVQDVLANGDLRVAGEQSVTVNDEPQKVTVEGRVRPMDISDGNVVLSTRVADARITYTGSGDITERSRRPWWREFLDVLGF